MRYFFALILFFSLVEARAQWDWGGSTSSSVQPATQWYNYTDRLPMASWAPDSAQRNKLYEIFAKNNFLCMECGEAYNLVFLFYKNKFVQQIGTNDAVPKEASEYIEGLLRSGVVDSAVISTMGMTARLSDSGVLAPTRSDSLLLMTTLFRKPWSLYPEKYGIAPSLPFYSDAYFESYDFMLKELKKKELLTSAGWLTVDFLAELKADGRIKILKNLNENEKYDFIGWYLESEMRCDSVWFYTEDSLHTVKPGDGFSGNRRFLLTFTFADRSVVLNTLATRHVKRYRRKISVEVIFTSFSYYTVKDCVVKPYATDIFYQQEFIFKGPGQQRIRLNDSMELVLNLIKTKIDGKKTYLYEIKQAETFTRIAGHNFSAFYAGMNIVGSGVLVNNTNYSINGRISLKCRGQYYINDGRKLKLE